MTEFDARSRFPIEDIQRHYVWLWVALIGVVLMTARTLLQDIPPAIVPDSSGYLEWSPVRTPGYPLFLLMVRSFDPSLSSLPYLTMALLVGSCAFLAQAASRLGGAWWIWVLFGAATLGDYFVWRYAWHVLSESLFVVMLMTLLGCVAMALARRPAGISWLIAGGVLLGAMILVRPVAYSLLGISLIVGFAWKGRRLASLAAIAIPAIAIILMASSWNFASKGFFGTQVFGGFNILAQVSLLATPDVKVDNPEAQSPLQAIVSPLSPIREALPKGLLAWQDYFWMTRLAYNTSLYGYDLPAISAADGSFSDESIASRSCYWCVSVPAAKRMNAVGWSIAKGTILRHPIEYLRIVAVNFVALWTIPEVTSVEEAAVIKAKLQSPGIKEFFDNSDPVEILIEIPDALVGVKNAIGFVLMLSAFALILALMVSRRRSALLAFSATAAVCLCAHHLLVALVEAGIFRYAMTMWPCLFAMIAGMAALAHGQIRAYRSGPTPDTRAA